MTHPDRPALAAAIDSGRNSVACRAFRRAKANHLRRERRPRGWIGLVEGEA